MSFWSKARGVLGRVAKGVGKGISSGLKFINDHKGEIATAVQTGKAIASML